MAGPLGSSHSPEDRPRARPGSPVGDRAAADAFFGRGDDGFWDRGERTRRADKATRPTRRAKAQPPPATRVDGRRPARTAATPTAAATGSVGRAGGRSRGEGPRGGPAGRPGPGTGGRRRGAGGNGGGGEGAGGPGRGGRGPGGGGPGGRPAPRRRSLVWRWRRPLFLVTLVMLALLVAVGALAASTELPEIETLKQTSYICDAEVTENCTSDNAMAKLQGDENRTSVALDEVPDVMVDAVVAMEDRDFFEHKGVNPFSIGRALYRDLKGDAVQQGGSTITQQYVKNAFLSPERSVTRKVKEAVLSIKLEQRMSKEEILEGYLNTIYFGRGAYGVAAASQAYFGRDISEIELAEAAYLASVIRNPASADASDHPKEAVRRRKTALVAMEEEGYITAEQAEKADAVKFEEPYYRPKSKVKKVDVLKGADKGNEYIVRYVNEELKRLGFDTEQIETSGLRVYTSIDPGMQGAAWDAVTSTLTDPEDPEASLVAVDDQGLVRAMVGSRHPYEAGKFENNYAVRGSGSDGRQTGSIFKPVALAEAVRRGYSLDSRFTADAKMEFPEAPDENGNPWKVSNYAESEQGVLDLVDATKASSNTAYAQLMLALGAQSVADLAERMGIGGGEELAPNPSLVLGTANATPLEMAGAYSTFANRGVYRKPDIVTRVEQMDEDGNVTVLYQRKVSEERILSESQSDLVTHALQGVITDGTGTAADIGKPAAGKTGTASHNWDAWFAGYVPKLTSVVWMGYPEGSIPMENVQGRETVTGGSLPAEIWRKFMELATVGTEDAFVEVSDEALHSGEVINREILTTEEEATTTTTAPPKTNTTTTTQRPGHGRPGPTTTQSTVVDTTTSSSSTTTTTAPQDTTETTVAIPGPPGKGGGG